MTTKEQLMRLEPSPYRMFIGETSKAYQAFSTYRDLGPQRSLEAARRALGKPSGYIRQMETWSSDHHWVRRCRHYDTMIQLEHAEEKERLLHEHYAYLRKRSQIILDKALEALESLDFEKVPPTILLKILELANTWRKEGLLEGAVEPKNTFQPVRNICRQYEHNTYSELRRILNPDSLLYFDHILKIPEEFSDDIALHVLGNPDEMSTTETTEKSGGTE